MDVSELCRGRTERNGKDVERLVNGGNLEENFEVAISEGVHRGVYNARFVSDHAMLERVFNLSLVGWDRVVFRPRAIRFGNRTPILGPNKKVRLDVAAPFEIIIEFHEYPIEFRLDPINITKHSMYVKGGASRTAPNSMIAITKAKMAIELKYRRQGFLYLTKLEASALVSTVENRAKSIRADSCTFTIDD
ncbi:unnamed protein product [Dovyalis caffra]|uniref:Uncharacterized protein n=1 Tax=Dovyalis caffra TaxID=77055 RepID=A0AAV1S1U5_9ROSI|nr:unnamed protein product [Dovyalis caffra]